jgi:hypothetical protein
MLFLDGAYTFSGDRGAAFHRARRPTDTELARLLHRLSQRIMRAVERRGILIADPVHPYLDFEPSFSLDQLQAASINYRIAIGLHAGRKVLTLYRVPPVDDAPNVPLLATVAGFSLHAATVCEAHQSECGASTSLCIETCPDCGGKLRVIACIEDPPLIAKILRHAQQRMEWSTVTSRGPPRHQAETLELT